jgi:peroxiredoxin
MLRRGCGRGDHAEKLDGLDVKVVSLSVDDEATARELIAKHGLTFDPGGPPLRGGTLTPL